MKKVHEPDGVLTTPNQLTVPKRRIAIGYDIAYGIKDDGSLWSWGTNYNGMSARKVPVQGIYTTQLIPEKIEGLPPIKSVFTDSNTTFVITTQGDIWFWKKNNDLNYKEDDIIRVNGLKPQKIETLSNIVDMSVGAGAFALDSNGQVFDLIVEGDSFKAVLVPNLSNMRLIANYGRHLLSVDQSGHIIITSRDKQTYSTKRMMNIPSKVVAVQAIPVIEAFVLLLEDGHIWTTANIGGYKESRSRPLFPIGIYPHLSKVKLISSDFQKIAAWTEDGKLVAFGADVEFRVVESIRMYFLSYSNKPSLFNKNMQVKELYAGGGAMAAVDQNGDVWFAMDNYRGVFGTGKTPAHHLDYELDPDWTTLQKSLFSNKSNTHSGARND